MHSLDHTWIVKVMDQFFFSLSICTFKYKICVSRFLNVHLCILVYIPICMTGNGDRLFPVAYTRLNSIYNNRCTEYGTIQDGTNSAVRAFVHFLQVILVHSCLIWGNGGTFYSNSVFLGCLCCIYSNLVICVISVLQAKIIIFSLQVNKRIQKFILNKLPENTGHLISVHLYKGCVHLNFCHLDIPPLLISM